MFTNFLTKAPVQLSLLKRGIPIEPSRLQSVSPGLTVNLGECCSYYVEGLIDLDKEFLKKTTAPYLFSIIEPEIDRLGEGSGPQKQLARKLDLKTKQQPQKQTQALKKYPYVIFPYVVFGAVPSERIKSHPYTSVTQVTRNRYIQSHSLTDIMNKHTYGFRCAFNTEEKLGYKLVITLEGDIQTHEYFVVDLGNQLAGGFAAQLV